MLALLLLAALAWGTTAEFNHHHGGRARIDQSLLSTTQAQDADDASSARIESDKTNGSSSSSSKTGAQCLICQFHQNLSATVLSHTPGSGIAEMFGLQPSPIAVFQLSEFTANGHGRAPPSNL